MKKLINAGFKASLRDCAPPPITLPSIPPPRYIGSCSAPLTATVSHIPKSPEVGLYLDVRSPSLSPQSTFYHSIKSYQFISRIRRPSSPLFRTPQLFVPLHSTAARKQDCGYADAASCSNHTLSLSHIILSPNFPWKCVCLRGKLLTVYAP